MDIRHHTGLFAQLNSLLLFAATRAPPTESARAVQWGARERSELLATLCAFSKRREGVGNSLPHCSQDFRRAVATHMYLITDARNQVLKIVRSLIILNKRSTNALPKENTTAAFKLQ